jgi:hypothetical protein
MQIHIISFLELHLWFDRQKDTLLLHCLMSKISKTLTLLSNHFTRHKNIFYHLNRAINPLIALITIVTLIYSIRKTKLLYLHFLALNRHVRYHVTNLLFVPSIILIIHFALYTKPFKLSFLLYLSSFNLLFSIGLIYYYFRYWLLLYLDLRNHIKLPYKIFKLFWIKWNPSISTILYKVFGT